MRIAIKESDFWSSNLHHPQREIEELICYSIYNGDLSTAWKLLLIRNLLLGIYTFKQFQEVRVYRALMDGKYPYYFLLTPSRARREVASGTPAPWDPRVLETNEDILNPENLRRRWPNKVFIEVRLDNGRKFYLTYNDVPWAFNAGLFIYDERVPVNNQPWQFECLLKLASEFEGFTLFLHDPRIGSSRPERFHIQFFSRDQGPLRHKMPFGNLMISRLYSKYQVGTVYGVEINRLNHVHPIYKAVSDNLDSLVAIYKMFVESWITEDRKYMYGIEVCVIYENGKWTVFFIPRSRNQYSPNYKKNFASSAELLGFMIIDSLNAMDELDRNPQKVFDKIFSQMRLPDAEVEALERVFSF